MKDEEEAPAAAEKEARKPVPTDPCGRCPGRGQKSHRRCYLNCQHYEDAIRRKR